MKKVFLIVFLLFQISFLFAEKEYLSSDGYFLYFFSDDFTEYKYTTLDDYGNFSETKKIQKKVSNGTIQSFNLSGKFTYVKFLITDIYEGTKYDDVAITTLQCY